MVWSKTRFFSRDLIHYQTIGQTEEYHYRGELVTFNNRTTALGGYYKESKRVEVFDNGTWNSSIIKELPADCQSTGSLVVLPALVTSAKGTETLFFFGKLDFRLD